MKPGLESALNDEGVWPFEKVENITWVNKPFEATKELAIVHSTPYPGDIQVEHAELYSYLCFLIEIPAVDSTARQHFTGE
ncbi:hypothetical protein IFR05_015052 [Cadophora sp. M221]|nr:hypothetical protein IFR05_015052 [Cadophora sp. M221]